MESALYDLIQGGTVRVVKPRSELVPSECYDYFSADTGVIEFPFRYVSDRPDFHALIHTVNATEFAGFRPKSIRVCKMRSEQRGDLLFDVTLTLSAKSCGDWTRLIDDGEMRVYKIYSAIEFRAHLDETEFRRQFDEWLTASFAIHLWGT